MDNKLTIKPELIAASLADYPTIQNMARFYAYDMSRECGFTSDEWVFPPDGLYVSHDFKKYFEDPIRKAFFVKINHELAGFALLNKAGTSRHLPYWQITLKYGEHITQAQLEWCDDTLKQLTKISKQSKE